MGDRAGSSPASDTREKKRGKLFPRFFLKITSYVNLSLHPDATGFVRI